MNSGCQSRFVHNKQFFPSLFFLFCKCKCKCNLFTHGAPRNSLELVQKCPCILGSNWNLEMLVFKERGKPEYPEKNLYFMHCLRLCVKCVIHQSYCLNLTFVTGHLSKGGSETCINKLTP